MKLKGNDISIGIISVGIISLLVLTSMQSCVNMRKATYFNNIGNATLPAKYPAPRPIIEAHDILKIEVSSMNPEASMLYNPQNVSNTNSDQESGYIVSQEGDIQFPVLGEIKAVGLTQEELGKKIRQELIDRKLLIDPIVSVKQVNFKVTVLGEVKDPGVIYVRNGNISLLEAIGRAGDLTIYGQRDQVLLIRKLPNGDKLTQRLDLNSDQILNSPFFYLKNNDVLYVEPNKARVASTGRGQVILPVVFSGISLLIIAVSYLINK